MTTALASYTLTQLTTDVLNLTGDVNQTRFATSIVNDAINAAIKLMVTKKGYTYIEKIIGVGAQVPPWNIFPLKGVLLDTGHTAYDVTDYIEIRRASFGIVPTSSLGPTAFNLITDRLNKTTLTIEDMNHPRWRSEASTPTRWALYNGSSISVFPQISSNVVVAGNTPVLSVGYIQQPLLLASSSDTVDSRIPYTVQQYIKYAAAAWLMSLDKSDTTSLNTAKLFQDTFEQLIGS